MTRSGATSRASSSTALARYGRAGRGRWVTVDANAGHAFMTVAG